jgi:hypothetical protein
MAYFFARGNGAPVAQKWIAAVPGTHLNDKSDRRHNSDRFPGRPVHNSDAREVCCVQSIRRYLTLYAVRLGVILLPASVCAQAPQSPASLSDVPLPGGIKAALVAMHDPVPPDRGQFLVEVIRRTYSAAIASRTDPRDAPLRALVAHLDRARQAEGPTPTEMVPLPLTAAIWTDLVFGGRTTPDALVGAILESRNASLFYYALMSLDPPTRDWIASQRNLVADLSTRYAPAFAAAAPGFRIAAGRVRLPGGDRMEHAWETLVGRRVTEPVEFLHALLTTNEGRSAYMLSAMSELSAGRLAFAAGDDPANAGASLRRLSTVFDRIAPGWKINDRTLWRPRRDPALLLSDMVIDDHGTPVLPGSRAFWAAVFASNPDGAPRGRDAEFVGSPPEFSWLCEQVFSGSPAEHRRRYETVLFASRVVKTLTPDTASDALDAVRSAFAYPALAAIIERARVVHVSTYAIAGRRAAGFSTISNDQRRERALTQFQGTVALLARMVTTGSITPAAFEDAVTSLSRIGWDRQGTYDGAVVKWFARWVASAKPDTNVDEALLQLLAGPAPVPPRYVDWEGTRYRVDLSAGESARLIRLLGEQPRGYLAAAMRASGDAADEAWARAAAELAYASALGQPERPVSIEELARRHDLGLRPELTHSVGPWTIPVTDASPRGYRVSGALLGLEVALAEFSLTRVSTNWPLRKPTISSEERAVFIETVPIVEPALLLDDDRDLIVNAMRTARARVAAIHTSDEADALIGSIPVGPIRRTVFPWIVAHDPSRAASFLSPMELLWLGLGDTPVRPSMNGWGVSARVRLGCLCLQVLDRRSADLLGGRVNAGILATGMPDLGLRLAELLAELHMPAALLGGVLASATFDFVNEAASRDEDDRRGPVEFVLALQVDRLEQYLALLTTGGPLVPPRGDSDRSIGVAPAGREP